MRPLSLCKILAGTFKRILHVINVQYDQCTHASIIFFNYFLRIYEYCNFYKFRQRMCKNCILNHVNYNAGETTHFLIIHISQQQNTWYDLSKEENICFLINKIYITMKEDNLSICKQAIIYVPVQNFVYNRFYFIL